MMDKRLALASILVVGLVLQVTALTTNTKDDVKLASERLLGNRLKRAWNLQEALIQEQRDRRNTNSFFRSIMKREANAGASDTNTADAANNGGDSGNTNGFAWSGGQANSNNV